MKALKYTATDFYTHSLSFHERERCAEIANEIHLTWFNKLLTQILSYTQGQSLMTETEMKELFE